MTTTRTKKASVDAAPETDQESPVDSGETIGTENETAFIDYVVTAKGALRLREAPSLDAPVVAELPGGVGVLGNDRPAENGWRQVFTGQLFGWVMDKFLEPMELPGLDDGAE